MKKTGAWLTRYGLEQLPITHTFGIPGMQNIEIYDELENSEKITPILVTHEEGASFAADGISRSSNNVGVCLIVPGAGLSNAYSGICESTLDGIPMIVIAGSARLDTGKHYQLHQLDQQLLARGAVKKSYHIKSFEEIVPSIFEAYEIATSDCPGSVFIEIPVEIQMFKGEISELPIYKAKDLKQPAISEISEAVILIKNAKHAGIFAGWGCKNATEELQELADLMQAPVSLTMQGYGVFPGTHPLHTGMSFGASAVPAAQNAFKKCDCMVAIATRFAEVATGSYGVTVPENLIHIDTDTEVFNKNFQAKVTIASDSKTALRALIDELKKDGYSKPKNKALISQIRKDKDGYYKSWTSKESKRVNPAVFLKALSDEIDEDDYVLSDVGNHAFLMAEHFTVKKAGHFIAPSDFNCMGYAVPASIGVKLSHPDKNVAAVVGDGCFLMTCMEILTASSNKAGIVYFVFHDGDLSQISQAQQVPYNRKTCTEVPEYTGYGISLSTGAAFIEIADNASITTGISEAFYLASKGQPVIVDVNVDYAHKTNYTKGVVKTNFKRVPVNEKARFIGRAIKRRLTE